MSTSLSTMSTSLSTMSTSLSTPEGQIFPVMGRGRPRLAFSAIPKFNFDLIPPPPWIAGKTMSKSSGRGRGLVPRVKPMAQGADNSTPNTAVNIQAPNDDNEVEVVTSPDADDTIAPENMVQTTNDDIFMSPEESSDSDHETKSSIVHCSISNIVTENSIAHANAESLGVHRVSSNLEDLTLSEPIQNDFSSVEENGKTEDCSDQQNETNDQLKTENFNISASFGRSTFNNCNPNTSNDCPTSIVSRLNNVTSASLEDLTLSESVQNDISSLEKNGEAEASSDQQNETGVHLKTENFNISASDERSAFDNCNPNDCPTSIVSHLNNVISTSLEDLTVSESVQKDISSLEINGETEANACSNQPSETNVQGKTENFNISGNSSYDNCDPIALNDYPASIVSQLNNVTSQNGNDFTKATNDTQMPFVENQNNFSNVHIAKDSDLSKCCEIVSQDESDIPELLSQSPKDTNVAAGFLNLAIEKKLINYKKNSDASERYQDYNQGRKPNNNFKIPQGSSSKSRNKTRKLKNLEESDSSDSVDKIGNRRVKNYPLLGDTRTPSPHHLAPNSRYSLPISKPQLQCEKEFPKLGENTTKQKGKSKAESSEKKAMSFKDVCSILKPIDVRNTAINDESDNAWGSDSSASGTDFLKQYKVKTAHASSKKLKLRNIPSQRCEDNLREFVSTFGQVKYLKLRTDGDSFTAYLQVSLQRDSFESLKNTLEGMDAAQFDPNGVSYNSDKSHAIVCEFLN